MVEGVSGRSRRTGRLGITLYYLTSLVSPSRLFFRTSQGPYVSLIYISHKVLQGVLQIFE